MKYKLMMNDKCDDCGLCTGNEYISDESNGKPIVRNGIISEEQRDYVQGIVDSCPTGALTLTKLERISFDDCIKKIDKLVKEFHLEIPQENEFCYDKKYCIYSLPNSTDDEFQYIYDSRDEAKSAGCRSFERNILCNTTNCIRQILNNYSIDKLGTYLEYKECPGNFYYEAIKKAERVLVLVYELVHQVADNYPVINSYTTISSSLVDDEKLYWCKQDLDTINTRSVTLAGRIRRNTGERFRSYFEVDSMYVDVSTLFGTKEKKKYAFIGLHNAAEEVRKDINSAVENNFHEYVQKYAYETVTKLVKNFQEILIEEIKRTTDSLIDDVKIFVEKGSSDQSRKFVIHKVIEDRNNDSKKSCSAGIGQSGICNEFVVTKEMEERREYGIPWRRGHKSSCSFFTDEMAVNSEITDFCNFANLDEESQKRLFVKHIVNGSDRNYIEFLQDYFYRKYKGYITPYIELPLDNPKRFDLYNQTALESGHPEYIVVWQIK